MQINNCTNKIKCDVLGCKNLAKYSFEKSNEKRSVLNLCEQCSSELYSAVGSVMVPKNIPAPYKNPKKLGEKR